MTKTDIGIYRGLKEKFDPAVHVGFFITTDTGELLVGDQSLGQTISRWEINDGVLTLELNTGRDIRVTFPEATETTKGLLSAADKAALNTLANDLAGKVDKVTGKSLVADSEIEKLGGLPNSTELTNSIATAKAAGDNAQSDLNAHKLNTSNPHSVTKEQVGLGNVTNDAQVKRSEMGVANGVATLDGTGKVPSSQLPSFVDDIVDVYATYQKSSTGVLSNIVLYSDAAKTKVVTGEAGKIYQNIAAGEPGYQFRWTGTVFAQTGASSLILGEVAGTAYDGAKGKANADNITKIKSTALSHIKDSGAITTTADKVSLNYDCYEGVQYGATGTAHTADIPAATSTKAGVMSANDKVEVDKVKNKIDTADAQAALDLKANISDLSNVLAEEAIDSPLLEEINQLTREQLKKDLFIDMWNEACIMGDKKYGQYNAETGYFELNGIIDIGYKEALTIYSYLPLSNRLSGSYDYRFIKLSKPVRTLFPLTVLYGSAPNYISTFTENWNLEKIVCHNPNSVGQFQWSIANGTDMFNRCINLVSIEPILVLNSTNYNIERMFYECYRLMNVKIHKLKQNIEFAQSPFLSLESFQYMVTNAANTSSITITVHPDVYAKLIDTSNTEWNKVLTDAAAKNISFVSA